MWPLGVFCVACAAFLVFFCFELWFFDQHSRNIHKYPDCRCFWKIGRYGMIQLASQRVTEVACWRQLAAPPSARVRPGLSPGALRICPLHSPTLLLDSIAFAFEPPVRLHCRLLSMLLILPCSLGLHWCLPSWTRFLGNSCVFHFLSFLFSIRKCLELLFI